MIKKKSNNQSSKTANNSRKKDIFIKILSVFLIIVLILNLFLFAFKIYNSTIMWIIIIIVAIISFPGMKILKKI
ncbi:MAG: hypothetical protein QXK76_02610 [Candidatus Woesearchaeota archaeon]